MLRRRTLVNVPAASTTVRYCHWLEVQLLSNICLTVEAAANRREKENVKLSDWMLTLGTLRNPGLRILMYPLSSWLRVVSSNASPVLLPMMTAGPTWLTEMSSRVPLNDQWAI
jgi:hypothetical protein